jgi:mannose-6-phosphate isomerase-like protein (cupin superfamily)
MANQAHLDLLRSDVDAWNEWRQANPGARPDLSEADLTAADLVMANLTNAELAGANLALANLRGADLRGADLSAANLIGARLLGVDLVGANLSGADLSTAEDLTQEELDETLGDDRTALPEGLSRPAHWLGIRKVNLAQAFASFSDHWWPRIVGDVNDIQVKVVKLLGDFVWHRHDAEDELMLVIKGRLRLRFRDRELWVEEGEFVIVPRGVEHQSAAPEECHLVLIEPKTTVNTGNVTNELTATRLERIG